MIGKEGVGFELEQKMIQDKRIEKGEQTRARILREAISLIAEKGIKEVSAAKLAKATGVSKSNIFHHFKSIDEILLSVLDVIFDDFLEQLKVEHRNLDEFLQSLGQIFFHVPEEHLKTFKAFFSFYHEGLFHSEYQKALILCSDQMIKLLCKHLTRLVSNSMAQETIESIATILLTTLDGIGLHYLLNKKGTRYTQAWQLQVQMISRLLSN